MLDAAGREVFRFPTARGVSLMGQPAGVYILQLEDGTRERVFKRD